VNGGILGSYVSETVFASIFMVTIWFRTFESDDDYDGSISKGNKDVMLRKCLGVRLSVR
jgi:hypothetical protein